METKSTLRQTLLEQRKAMDASTVRDLSQSIFERLKIYLENTRFKNILMYHPIHNEVDTTTMFAYFWKLKKRIFLPIVRNHLLYPVAYYPDQPLRSGPYNIPEPEIMLSPDDLHASIDIALIPCVACDKKKYRLGYGKGFYDRFLTHDLLKIGLCYDFQLINDLPVEHHDIPLDIVITEKETLE